MELLIFPHVIDAASLADFAVPLIVLRAMKVVFMTIESLGFRWD